METDTAYMLRALEQARLSDDPRTQAGAVVLNTKIGQSVGHSNFVPFKDAEWVWEDPKAKRLLVCHAEAAAIESYCFTYDALPEGCTMYASWACCLDCARKIVDSGIKRLVVCKEFLDATPKHWEDAVVAGLEHCSIHGVEVEFLPMGAEVVKGIRFDGREMGS
jgi:dCMP deaminase